MAMGMPTRKRLCTTPVAMAAEVAMVAEVVMVAAVVVAVEMLD